MISRFFLLCSLVVCGVILNRTARAQSDSLNSDSLKIAPWIMGGELVTNADPIAASTVMLETDIQYCTGTLIAQGVILTAAHCLSDRPEVIKIYFRGLASALQEQRSTDRYLLHEGYRDIKDTDDRNDLALVFFDGPLPTGMQPVALPFQQSSLSEKQTLWVAGFGHSNLGQLRKIGLSLWQFSKGKTLFWLHQVKGQGACHGDSGGPAYQFIEGRLYVVGVTSYAHTSNCESFSIYTHLEPYLPWLQLHLPKP